jgi:hypothetical protein
MSDDCKQDQQKQRRENWQEVRDLLNFNRPTKGPLSTTLQEWLDENPSGMDEDEIENYVDAIRAEMIAIRCACIARACPDTPFYMRNISDTLGVWAGSAMKKEMEIALRDSPLGRILYGAMFGEEISDDDVE